MLHIQFVSACLPNLQLLHIQGADHGESENVENDTMLNGAYVSMKMDVIS
jgi:hypothetical protein